MSIQKEMEKKPTKKGKTTKESQKVTFEEFLSALRDDVDPLKHAGEGWFATDEYARPGDIADPYVRGDVMSEGVYYPGPDKRNKLRNY